MFNENRLLLLQQELNRSREKLGNAIVRVSQSPESYNDPETLQHELTVMIEFSDAYDLFLNRMLSFSRQRLQESFSKDDLDATSSMLESVENFPGLVNDLKV